MEQKKKYTTIVINIQEQINEVLKTLPKREAFVLKKRFGLEDGQERTLKEVGEELKLSAERIRQIEAKALRILKHPSRSRKLKDLVTKDRDKSEKIADFSIDSSILLISQNVYKEMILYFSSNPEEMKTMDHRTLEEMIAELFDGFGYEVELTAQTRDGGRDIIAIKDSEVKVRYLIEAKRPDPGTPVGVRPVRELYGVKTRERATKAILATTTYFSAPAIAEFEENIWELELRDYDGIMEWVNAYKKGNI